MVDCTHHWTVTSPCPFCQQVEIDKLRAELNDLYLALTGDVDGNATIEDAKRAVHELLAENVASDDEIDRLREERETESLRLAACGVAAMQNTPDTIKERISREHEYWSASYGDVCDAVDREMALRARLARLEEAAKKGCYAVDSLIEQSRGVIGLHLNGDEAPWDELLSGGQYEEWLRDFDALRDALEPAPVEPKPQPGWMDRRLAEAIVRANIGPQFAELVIVALAQPVEPLCDECGDSGLIFVGQTLENQEYEPCPACRKGDA